MSPATFDKLLPAFSKTSLVFLQGWGEPFMNPDFFTMAATAKDAGCRVGTTTNGMLLDDEKISRLVELKLDVVCFSLAGVDEENDQKRKGTRIEKVLSAIRSLSAAKKSLNASRPAIHIAYMLLRSRLGDLEKIPNFFQGLDISQIVITTLDFIAAPELRAEALIPINQFQYHEMHSRLEALAVEGKRCGLNIYYQLSFPGKRRVTCSENVLKAFFVSADGDVSPCVFSGIPASRASYVVKEGNRSLRRLVFGNLNEESPADIWQNKAYKSFRNSIFNQQPNELCQDCPKYYMA
jgi:MoaA/NifB/PqqE/SkfB family radical SAM enzyme